MRPSASALAVIVAAPLRACHTAARWLLPEPAGPNSASPGAGQSGQRSIHATAAALLGATRKSPRPSAARCGSSRTSWRAGMATLAFRRVAAGFGAMPDPGGNGAGARRAPHQGNQIVEIHGFLGGSVFSFLGRSPGGVPGVGGSSVSLIVV